MTGDGCGIEIIAPSGAAISGGKDHGNALGCGLLPQGVVEVVQRDAETLLTSAKTFTHDGIEIVVDDVES